METVAQRVKAFSGEVTFESLRDFITAIDLDSLDYSGHVNDPLCEGDYGRNILTMQPFECVLIHWPPEVESAVHLHEGLFGYVWVLEGELDNISYRKEDDSLVEFAINRYGRGGLIPEPDGVIHKLRNNSRESRAITLHFYYPCIESFEGMEIYNLETGALGILSDDAKTASWQETPGHFRSLTEKAFDFVSFDEHNKTKSHLISYVIPKPETDRINDMNAAYFCEQAERYDFSDYNQPKRRTYIDSINSLVAEAIKAKGQIEKHLDIATGTGRRALSIREESGMDYEIVGVDISESMCALAESKGLRTYHQDWANDDSHTGEYFDAVTLLYAFGHLATEEARVRTLRKVHSYLKEDGVFYFDVFSLRNRNEWGSLVENAFEERRLEEFGYQLGDVFYRKRGLNELAFLHYSTEQEISELLDRCGFEVFSLSYVGYAKNPGEFVGSELEGNIFIGARKK